MLDILSRNVESNISKLDDAAPSLTGYVLPPTSTVSPGWIPSRLALTTAPENAFPSLHEHGEQLQVEQCPSFIAGTAS
jgi:hypothetical protein